MTCGNTMKETKEGINRDLTVNGVMRKHFCLEKQAL
jgi:hypothetical protein